MSEHGPAVHSLAQSFCARQEGLPVSAMHANPVRSLDAQLRTNARFGFDGPPFYAYATHGTWEWGAGLPYPSSELHGEPVPPHHPVTSPEEVETLELPDVGKAGMLPVALRFSELQRERGLPVSVQVGGVLTVAAGACGLARLCVWMLERPETAHALLHKAAQHLHEIVARWVERFGAANVTPRIWECLAAAPILSPRQWRERVLPHARDLHERILALGVRQIWCHACGDQEPNLRHWAELPMGNPSFVSLGAEVELEEASRWLPRHVLVGNLSPGLLEKGAPKQVYEATRTCVAKGLRHPGGFLLAPGCELPPATPAANLRAMRAAARDASPRGAKRPP